jgi:formamidopyrimidine-DNA glycosylase
MPELPDLQASSRNLDKRFSNKKVVKLTIFNNKKLNAHVENFTKNIEGYILEKLKRNGKELLLTFNNNTKLGIHLMLKGEIHLLSEIGIKHKIFDIMFENSDGFSVTDSMGQAKLILNPELSNVPDALSEEFNIAYLKPILQKSKFNIKKMLKDQDVVRGIGNAYADEILWEAKVSPLSFSCKIPDEKIEDIILSTKNVLNDAIKQIEQISPNIISGEIRDFLKVHKTIFPISPTGSRINCIELDGKKTYFTDEQILFE